MECCINLLFHNLLFHCVLVCLTRHEFVKVDDVIPEAGKALVFQHQLPHQGAVVMDGTKIILRMDMY